jgi:diguanylate cyclase (GGDEF)-like protein
MITYSVAGLHFARILLNTKDYSPQLDKIVVSTTLIFPIGMFIGFLFNQLVFSMILAFILNSCFVVLFIAMGISALKANKPFSIIFIISSVTAAICITVSTLAVAGVVVPYNDYTFKALEVGMAFEAILLAVILARQFRVAKIDKLVAENYARTDMLTQINNRRGFQDVAATLFKSIARNRRNAAIVLIDIDSFKLFNDQYGHDTGDIVLQKVAKCIENTARKSDVTARWGGEEFIILLPETSQDKASQQAERVRSSIENLNITIKGTSLSITVSLGVAGSENNLFNGDEFLISDLEPLIKAADDALYQAKQSGKNKIVINDSINNRN